MADQLPKTAKELAAALSVLGHKIIDGEKLEVADATLLWYASGWLTTKEERDG